MQCSDTNLVTSYYLPAGSDNVKWNSRMVIKTDQAKASRHPSYIINSGGAEEPKLEFTLNPTGSTLRTWPPKDMYARSNTNIF